MNLLPNRLKKGDTIGIITPSTAISDNDIDLFNKGILYFKNKGFNVKVGKNALLKSLEYSLTPEEKAEDINEMFNDNSINAIICSQGGKNSISALEHINWEIIKNNPKIFLGFSDISVLLNAINTKTGMITFLGHDLIWGFGRGLTIYDEDEFNTRLMQIDTNRVRTNGEESVIRSGNVSGKLLGGTVQCFIRLAGTNYFPDFSDAILFMEAVNLDPAGYDALLWQLKHIGVFDKIKGCIIGYNDGIDGKVKKEHHLENILKGITLSYDFPILKVTYSGHNCPNTVLPVGAKINLNTDTKQITILDKYLN